MDFFPLAHITNKHVSLKSDPEKQRLLPKNSNNSGYETDSIDTALFKTGFQSSEQELNRATLKFETIAQKRELKNNQTCCRQGIFLSIKKKFSAFISCINNLRISCCAKKKIKEKYEYKKAQTNLSEEDKFFNNLDKNNEFSNFEKKMFVKLYEKKINYYEIQCDTTISSKNKQLEKLDKKINSLITPFTNKYTAYSTHKKKILETIECIEYMAYSRVRIEMNEKQNMHRHEAPVSANSNIDFINFNEESN